ncbi:hypothetical protein SBRY_90106 [Actinacidiphila bryophytorum]|uniref:Uncharacterized protein n=1 Tax=Actinacidiphila bryophytorum TaxID=1436133 RepID=A0A9W4H7K4_9ACTN|nr:hypothetical protein SBRY_90106 [Actinacidiphila bryophytorum]
MIARAFTVAPDPYTGRPLQERMESRVAHFDENQTTSPADDLRRPGRGQCHRTGRPGRAGSGRCRGARRRGPGRSHRRTPAPGTVLHHARQGRVHLLRPAPCRHQAGQGPHRGRRHAQRLGGERPAERLQPADGRRRGTDRRHRRRVRRPERRGRPRDLPPAVRVAGLHHRQRLLQQGGPARRGQLPLPRPRLGR